MQAVAGNRFRLNESGDIMIPIHGIAAILSMLLLVCSVPAYADENEPAAVTPMRLSYAEGSVSFWRYGAPDWVDAQLNTPLAAGDSLYVGDDGDLELQIDSRSFVRADDNTQLTLVNQTPDFLQFKVATGRVSFDLRALPVGNSVEVDTPNAVFNIDHVGYYRVDVDGDVHFITRRGGRATIVPAGGQAMSINPSEEIVVSGVTVAQAVTYAAPLIDSWDRWNYDRTEGLLDAVSDRYLPYGIAGASDLDQYGSWRVVPDYGPIWVPDDVTSDWAPYSTGSWTWDPYYEWTWIDDAPWGWAPFHYGRWVHLDGYWGWAPGPLTRRPVYAPALVAFFNTGPGPGISVGIGSDGMGWVALGWGEPLTPWWGRPGFIGRPWWGGWGGPHMVNNRMVRDDTFVDMHRVTYENARVDHAVVATTRERFGHGDVQDNRMHVTQIRDWVDIHGALPLKAGPENLVAGGRQGIRPPESVLSRPVVATRPQQQPTLPWRSQAQAQQREEHRFILVPGQTSGQTSGQYSVELPRPAYGGQTGAELPRPALPPRFTERHREAATGNAGPEHAGRTQPSAEERGITPPAMAAQRTTRQSAPQLSAQPQERANLPGNPANRVYRDDRSSGESFQNNNDNPGFERQRSR